VIKLIKRIYVILALAGIVLFISCGIAHNNLPPYPLGAGKYQGSFTLSYDLNGLTLIPDLGMSFYWGMGKRINLGFGLGSPINLQHLTVAKYTKSTNNQYFNYYLSTKNLFIGYYDINIELGASYINKVDSNYHQFSSGIWLLPFGDKRAFVRPSDLSGFYHPDSYSLAGFNSEKRLRPFINYSYSYKDGRFSIHNSPGMTRTILSRDFQLLENIPSVSICYKDIKTIQYSNNDTISNCDLEICLQNRKMYLIKDYIGPCDALGPDRSRVRLMRLKPKDDYELRFLGNSNTYWGNQIAGIYMLKSSYVFNQYKKKSDLTFINTSEYTKKALDRIKWYKHDWSICLAMRTKH
jgi:hypothetical protein